jgi:hypothetical protein
MSASVIRRGARRRQRADRRREVDSRASSLTFRAVVGAIVARFVAMVLIAH